MKQDLIEKIKNLHSELLDPDSEWMVMSEDCLEDQDLEEFARLMTDVSVTLEKAKLLVEQKGLDLSKSEIEEIGEIAQDLDDSGDEELQKQASVLDEILLTIGSDKGLQKAFKKAEMDEIDRLRSKYRKEKGEELYSTSDSSFGKDKQEEYEKAVKEKVKTFRPLEAPLTTRYCPDMPGVPMMRISDGVWQNPITKKIYDFSAGFTTEKGNKVPGTSVSGQTDMNQRAEHEHMMFSTREGALNGS